jgi:hypothetical protein
MVLIREKWTLFWSSLATAVPSGVRAFAVPTTLSNKSFNQLNSNTGIVLQTPKDPYFNVFFDFNHHMYKWSKSEEDANQKRKSENFYLTYVQPIEKNITEIEENAKRLKRLKTGLHEFESNDALNNAAEDEKQIIASTIR